MLPRINRLTKKKDFEKLFKKGKSFKNGFLMLKTAPNNLEESRFGFIISQKVSKKAVLRNKIKRRLRDIVRQNMGTLKKGIDIALVVLPGLEKKNFSEIKDFVNALFKKAGLIDDKQNNLTI